MGKEKKFDENIQSRIMEGLRSSRPEFPKRAIITGGMPYGNKDLHFGHIGGVFTHADIFTRFLRDRIGQDNVIFVSGTDCYGSPIVAGYNKLVQEGKFSGTIQDFVEKNHKSQKDTLERYEVSLNLFGTSGLYRSGEIHTRMCNDFLEQLYENGWLEKRSTLQFYDPEYKVFLNGRQVLGRCPVPGCQSEKAYADECSLGHPYEPKELIDPVSTLSGKKPEMVEVTNWYIDLNRFSDELVKWVDQLKKTKGYRPYVISIIEEFLQPPVTHVKSDQMDDLRKLLTTLPLHELIDNEKSKSVTLKFNSLDDREKACEILNSNNIRYRNGKTLTPFRLTGNVEWGVPVNPIEGLDGLTFWVWPESLIAPVSFTAAYLEKNGKPENEWKKWWCSDDALVYQFIGEDNIYFYTLAEMAIYMGTNKTGATADPGEGEMHLPYIISNKHILYYDTKASSSSEIKPPMAAELLDYYTAEQLRAHFFALGLGSKSVSFKPKPFSPNPEEMESDPVLKEGNLISNVLNRAVRSCFYTTQKYFDNHIPVGVVSKEIEEESEKLILEYEKKMAIHEFHAVMAKLDKYIRDINKYWNRNMQEASQTEDLKLIAQTIIDGFHMVRVSTVLMHPIAPVGTEKTVEYLNMDKKFFDWSYIFKDIYYFMDDPLTHKIVNLEPRFDFFDKHESQINY